MFVKSGSQEPTGILRPYANTFNELILVSALFVRLDRTRYIIHASEYVHEEILASVI